MKNYLKVNEKRTPEIINYCMLAGRITNHNGS